MKRCCVTIGKTRGAIALLGSAFLAGKAGGRHKAGQHIHAVGEPVTRVSLTAQQLVGAPVGEFGSGSMRTARPIAEIIA